MADDNDGLTAVAQVLADAEEMLLSECMNSSAKTCVKAAVALAGSREKGSKDSLVRVSAEARQWLKEARDFNKADADLILAKLMAEHEEKKKRAKKRSRLRLDEEPRLDS